MYRIEQRIELKSPAELSGCLVLPYDLRQRSRFKTSSSEGQAVGVFLPRGTVLCDGDILQDDAGRLFRVIAKDEAVSEVLSEDPFALSRAAYHLGNRHVPLQIGEGWLRYQPDHVLDDMVVGLGLQVNHCTKPFHPESGAYSHAGAHGHAHSHEHSDEHKHGNSHLTGEEHGHSH